MGTVALGGVINVMPMLYGKVAPVRSQVRGFRTAVLAGLGTCAILNILWCWSVLDIVPQLNSCFSYNMKENNTFHIMTGQATQQRMLCYHNLSLEEAEKNGEISTIPLTKIIQSLYPSFSWVALLVELFIMISITVSYLTIGAALHHTLSGIVSSFWTSSNSKYSPQSGRCKGCSKQCLVASVLSLVAFTLVFCVAMYNPKSFAIVLEKAVSLLMNLEQGILVYFMIWTSLNTEYIKLRIPLPLPKCVYYMYHLLPVYFGFAVAYDIYVSTHDIIWPQITQYIDDFMTANLTRGNFTTTVSEIMSISTNAMAKDSTYSPLATTENSSIVTLHSQTPMLMTMTNVLTTLTNGVTASIVNSTSP
ncbi:unnamed protein product [Owenia fusiformis]|nr:unnamed protein product [Owenia fusiformis]